MLVALEGQSLFGPRTGVHRYAAELVLRLPPALPQTQFEFLCFDFLGRRGVTPPVVAEAGLRPRRVRLIPGRVYYRLLRYGIAPAVRTRAHMAIFPNFVTWNVGRIPTVPVIHDVAFFRHPDYIEQSNLDFLRRALPRTVARAWRIVAASEHTRRELMELMGVAGERVVVARSPLGEPFRRALRGAEPRADPSHDTPYLLFVGTLEPRKNVEGLVRAFSTLPAARERALRLVLAGGFGWRTEGIRAEIARAHASGLLVEQRGSVDDAQLIALYRGALALVLPSHHEGFGLPVVEAMMAGCPVISSNTSSLPEVAGPAALLVDPLDAEEITTAMYRVLHDEDLRLQMIQDGREWVSRFSWEQTALATREVLASIPMQKGQQNRLLTSEKVRESARPALTEVPF